MQKTDWNRLAQENMQGRVILLPTDTIYGFSCGSFDYEAQQKIMELKQRDTSKYFINLISSIDDIKKFSVEITDRQRSFLEKNWPERLTVIFKDSNGTKISFRMPAHEKLREFIKKVGPIVSTSANIYNKPHIQQPTDLADFMKEQIDYYIDEGELSNPPSMIIEIIR